MTSTARRYAHESTVMFSDRERSALESLAGLWGIPPTEAIRRAIHSTAEANRSKPMIPVRAPRPHKRMIRLSGFDLADLRWLTHRWACTMSDAVRLSVAATLKSEAVRTLIRDSKLAQVEAL